MLFKKISFILAISLISFGVSAQYFGQNKPRYESFQFKLNESPHFEIYSYLKNGEKLLEIGQDAEHWYQLHQAVLQDTFKKKNPLIIYSDHGDFQQTNAISGGISIGTGGVTEGLKNRVILPLAASNQQTHHVLGHEMVHAFQYHMVINGDSTSLQNMGNFPLWLVEGLAEYLSIGRIDAHTSMWMRDAVLNKDIPTIKKLNSSRYFPYRYGQAFWAFLTGNYGDEVIKPLFMNTAKYGFDVAVDSTLGIKVKTLNELWLSALKTHYGQFNLEQKRKAMGKEILSYENAGELNISPVLSPDGKHVIFYSQKDLFSLDLYLADARTGKMIRKVASSGKASHVDDFSSIESAGTWSPDGKEFAFVAVSKGDHILIVKDVETGKTSREIRLKDVPFFTNPAWSPDGKSILISGLKQGQSDLFLINVKNKRTQQLTNDKYSEIQAQWSPDGEEIVFASDRLSQQNGKVHGKWKFNISLFNLADEKITDLNIFPGADNLNPVFNSEGHVYFLSDRDGFRNIYAYDFVKDSVYQKTDLKTGVSGITKYSPAISIARKTDRLAYSLFYGGKYSIYQIALDRLLNDPVDKLAVDETAATLPVVGLAKTDAVNTNLEKLNSLKRIGEEELKRVKYKSKFKLDYLGGGAGVGIGTSLFGTGTAMAGGIDMLFGDILGDHQIYAGASLNGEIIDAGAQVTYINRKRRIAWGGSLGHIPYRSAQYYYPTMDTLQYSDGNLLPVLNYRTDLVRLFEDQLAVFAHYPFSKQLRLEAGASAAFYGYRIDKYNSYYDQIGRLVFEEKEKLEAPDGFTLQSLDAAYVGDNAQFGLTSPLRGYRFRIGAQQYFGNWNFQAFTVDLRKYFRLKPVTVAVRGLHYGRYGSDANNVTPLYLGQQNLMHGYNFNASSQEFLNNLIGSKVLVSNFEVRLPFSGPRQLALIESRFLLTEFAWFLDGGIAFNEFTELGNGNDQFKPEAIYSTGISLRVNLFGALVVEPYYAWALTGPDKRGRFGFNFIPGW